jgi:hypothetical protein
MKFLFNSEEEFIEHIKKLAKNFDLLHENDGDWKEEYGPRNLYSGPYFGSKESIENAYGVFFGTQEEYDYFIMGKDVPEEEAQRLEEGNDSTPLSESNIMIVDKDLFPRSYPVVVVLVADKCFDRFGDTDVFFQEYVYLSDFKRTGQ